MALFTFVSPQWSLLRFTLFGRISRKSRVIDTHCALWTLVLRAETQWKKILFIRIFFTAESISQRAFTHKHKSFHKNDSGFFNISTLLLPVFPPNHCKTGVIEVLLPFTTELCFKSILCFTSFIIFFSLGTFINLFASNHKDIWNSDYRLWRQ